MKWIKLKNKYINRKICIKLKNIYIFINKKDLKELNQRNERKT